MALAEKKDQTIGSDPVLSARAGEAAANESGTCANMSRGVEIWLERVDEAGAGALAPQHCRANLLEAEGLLEPCRPQPLHFVEFPLLGDPGFDMTWSVSFQDILDAQGIPPELESAKRLAADMAPEGVLMFEYDISEPTLPRAGFYYKGMLADGRHAVGRMLECAGRAGEKRAALLAAAKLAKLGYESCMCGIMTGRDGSPVRITARPVGEFDATRLLTDLALLGFDKLPLESFAELDALCRPNEYMFSAPLVYLDVMPGGTLGPTLGIELNGVNAGNVCDYPQMRLARAWGLADDRWKVLCDASFNDDGNFVFVPNTLKFRWRDGEPLPAKLYMKAGWQ